MPIKNVLLMSALLATLGATSQAFAAYDMSGKWLAVSQDGLSSLSRWELSQSAGTLQYTISNSVGTLSGGGTIDEETGAFALEVPDYRFCEVDTLEGFVAADGRSFTAIYSIHALFLPAQCIHQTVSFIGSRCGNGELDAGEDCDDGNATDDDCCTATCTIGADGNACSELHGCGSGTCTSGTCVVSAPEPAGTPCDPDTNECTDDVCDGAGTCGHPYNTVPCAAPHGCGSRICAEGSCVVSVPAAPGSSCDLDASVCTPDTCDGAGGCVAGAEVGCPLCERCDDERGCVADLGDCDTTPDKIQIKLKTDPEGGEDEKLIVSIRDAIDPVDLGDPTVSTEYTLCLYRPDSATNRMRSIGAMVIPAGGTCGSKSCWKRLPRGFAYKDSTREADGIASVRLDQVKGIKIAGKKANLPLPPMLMPVTSIPITPKVVASDGVTTRCWSHPVWPEKYTAASFKGRYTAP